MTLTDAQADEIIAEAAHRQRTWAELIERCWERYVYADKLFGLRSRQTLDAWNRLESARQDRDNEYATMKGAANGTQ